MLDSRVPKLERKAEPDNRGHVKNFDLKVFVLGVDS